MSLDALDTQLDALRADASRVQDVLRSRVSDVEKDGSLSSEGRKARIAESREAAATRLRALRAQEDTLVKAKLTELERTIDAKSGNTATDLIAFRDAQDRAERIDEQDEAARVLNRALRTNDTSLAHAIFRRALDKGWSGTVNEFTSAHPDISDTVKDLNMLHSFKERTLERAVAYSTM